MNVSLGSRGFLVTIHDFSTRKAHCPNSQKEHCALACYNILFFFWLRPYFCLVLIRFQINYLFWNFLNSLFFIENSGFVMICDILAYNKYILGSSMSFYPDFILILSWFYLDFILILSRFYPDFLKTHFIQILSWFYPNFWKYLDKIRIKSG